MSDDTLTRVAQTALDRDAAADRWVHLLGMPVGALGAVVLIVRALTGVNGADVLPVTIYAFGLVAMLTCSAAYNLALDPVRRGFLRRLDHAAIFLMIAGTYTPFTARVEDGAVAFWLTATVWSVALAGVCMKLAAPGRFERLSIVVYLALGWTVLAAFGPMTAALDPLTTDLIIVGGVLYSVGVAFYMWETLPFQRAIWHLFVLAAASCHFSAVFRIVS